MTDEGILKRLAEIEGWEWSPLSECWKGAKIVGGQSRGTEPKNPLNNWSDLGPLIEKHKVDIFWNPSDLDALDDERGLYWETEIFDYSDPHEYKVRSSANHKSLPHAICLAIIEAHK